MKVLLASILVFASLSANAVTVQELIIGKGHYSPNSNCAFLNHDMVEAQTRADRNAELQCPGGSLRRVTDYATVVDQPVTTFCYPSTVAALYECLKDVQTEK